MWDGNKRTACIAMIEFIERNGCALRVGPAETEVVVATMVKVAAGELSEQEFVAWVQRRITPRVME